MYTAALTLPHTLPIKERQDIVNELIADLGLEVCRDTIVGDIFFKGLSGGEYTVVTV
jgi:hypothetical protein